MALMPDHQPDTESLQSPEYWWYLIKATNQYWINGDLSDEQIGNLEEFTEEKISRTESNTIFDHHEGYAGANLNDAKYLPRTPLLLACEDPEKSTDGMVGFSYQVAVKSGNGEVPFAFNFRLPIEDAKELIGVVEKNGSLMEMILQKRYAPLRLDRVPANILPVLLNVRHLFSQPEDDERTVEEWNTMYENNLVVHPVKLGDIKPGDQEDQKNYYRGVRRNLFPHGRKEKRG